MQSDIGIVARERRTASAQRDRNAAPVRRKANVLLLTTDLCIGGAEVVLRNLARTLDRRRFNVSICCLKLLGPIGRELAADGLDIAVLPNTAPGGVDYFTALRLRRVLREKNIDIVHTHTTHALTDVALCRCLAPRIKVVHTFHFGNYPNKPMRTLLMEGIFSRFADRLIAVGDVQKEQIRSTYWLSDEAIGTIRNGVRLPDRTAADSDFRASLGAGSKVLVGTIASMIPQKGLHDLLTVARRVHDIREDVHFVVVGGGDLLAELEQKRRALGLDNDVTFTGWLPSAAERALPAFDIYFQPSLWEAMSISILEAMAAAKPVVSTNVGEAPRLIEHGATGFLYAPGDAEGMAAAILRLARDESLRRSIGRAAALDLRDRFTVNHMTRAYEKVYLNVLQWDGSTGPNAGG